MAYMPQSIPITSPVDDQALLNALNILTTTLNSSTLANVVDTVALKEMAKENSFRLKEKFVKEVHQHKITVGTISKNGRLYYTVYTNLAH